MTPTNANFPVSSMPQFNKMNQINQQSNPLVSETIARFNSINQHNHHSHNQHNQWVSTTPRQQLQQLQQQQQQQSAQSFPNPTNLIKK